jgi:hypothetical protein
MQERGNILNLDLGNVGVDTYTHVAGNNPYYYHRLFDDTAARTIALRVPVLCLWVFFLLDDFFPFCLLAVSTLFSYIRKIPLANADVRTDVC